jgi:hypothetical protein
MDPCSSGLQLDTEEEERGTVVKGGCGGSDAEEPESEGASRVGI